MLYIYEMKVLLLNAIHAFYFIYFLNFNFLIFNFKFFIFHFIHFILNVMVSQAKQQNISWEIRFYFERIKAKVEPC